MEMYKIYIEDIDGRQEIIINKNLSINNIIASLQLDICNEQALSYNNQTRRGWEKIKDTLRDSSTVVINRPNK